MEVVIDKRKSFNEMMTTDSGLKQVGGGDDDSGRVEPILRHNLNEIRTKVKEREGASMTMEKGITRTLLEQRMMMKRVIMKEKSIDKNKMEDESAVRQKMRAEKIDM